MANPFGKVVDNEMLKSMSRYRKKPEITQEDRAREAMILKNDKSKFDEARAYAQDVYDGFGDGPSTMCLIYNATGDTLHYVEGHDWMGQIGRTPYPTEIGNGQWAAVVHVSGSEAAVVYRGKDKDGHDRDYMISWANPPGVWDNNKSYSEEGAVNSFQQRWSDIHQNLGDAGYSDTTTRDGWPIIEVDIAQGFCAQLQATISTKFSD